MIGIGGDSGSGKDYTYKIVSSIFSSDTHFAFKVMMIINGKEVIKNGKLLLI